MMYGFKHCLFSQLKVKVNNILMSEDVDQIHHTAHDDLEVRRVRRLLSRGSKTPLDNDKLQFIV